MPCFHFSCKFTMSNMENNDEIIVNNQNWNKLTQGASKSGYRDGITDGQNLNFQQYFDKGFEQGFKNAYILGLYKGTLSCHNQSSQNLDKTTRGNCVICNNSEEKSIQDIITQQTDSTNNTLLELQNENTQNLPQKLN